MDWVILSLGRDPMSTESLLSILVGIGLSAACGFRVFVPLLIMSIASHSGQMTLSEGFQWIGSFPALLAFAIATVFEVLGYYIPWVDHVLDLAATPASVIAGTLVMASAVSGMSPFMRWSLALIAGGGVAAAVQTFTGVTRLTSTATTSGLGNPVVATAELGMSAFLSALAILLPLAAAAAVVAVLYFIGRKFFKARGPRPSAKIP
jgi:hypothetical protein